LGVAADADVGSGRGHPGVELGEGEPASLLERLALTEHVAELAHTVENHGLLLARLLDKE